MIMPTEEFKLDSEEKKVADELAALIQMRLRISDRHVFCRICRFYNALCLRNGAEILKARQMVLQGISGNKDELETLLWEVENLFNRKRSPGRLSLCSD